MKLTYLVLRDLLKRWKTLLIVVVTITVLVLAMLGGNYLLSVINDGDQVQVQNQHKWIAVAVMTVVFWLFVFICRSLTNIYSLRKKETSITWCQISILIAIGLWLIGFVIILDVKSNPKFATAIGILGTIITWIFQDTLKGVVAFLHLRMNNMLCIDDWIQIPKLGVDGQVVRVSLTNVIIYNWDTTTSSIPTSTLHSEHFINLQKMMKGKTYGRRMLKTFIMDTGWFHPISKEEADKIRQSEEIVRYLPVEEIKDGMSNAQLFRLYLFHWLMNHPHVSQQPRLVVRWLEQTENGMPLQIYAYIIDSTLVSYEWQQSQIMEHIIESIDWFGLHLFQNPSNYDVGYSNIYLTNKPASYRKETIS